MSLTIGTQLGSHEITALLGKGGMGEVYRARDTRLNREVAIKILPDEFARDAERIARFHREAEVLASLSHPNIAGIYDLAEANGSRYLVLELVEGETLAERIARGPISAEEALAIAKSICGALEAAHDKGIIHRDLKPANVKIAPDGRVKVLDFGLAKAMEDMPRSGAPSNSPTLMSGASTPGMILGTAAYMSPEQAKGKHADRRSDIWSFGVLLYEMTTGKQLFTGDEITEILAAVIKEEPKLDRVPARLRPAIERCLRKDPRKRWYSMEDVRFALDELPSAGAEQPTVVVKRRPILPWIAAAVFGCAALALGYVAYQHFTEAPPIITKFSILPAEGQQFNFATNRLFASISPDGSQIVYGANAQLFLRSMDELAAKPIPGTDTRAGEANPVFSPDGQFIAFFSNADQTIKKIAISGGAAVTLCPAIAPLGMNWGQDGIVFGQSNAGILRVSENGGKPEVLVKLKEGEQFIGPQMLLGGEALLFTVAPNLPADWDKAQTVAQTLKSGTRKVLHEGGSDARYLPTGHIVYSSGGTLFAVPFDVRRLEVTGGAVPLVEGVARTLGGASQFSFSNSGSLIYVPGPAAAGSAQYSLAMTDRKGEVEPLKLAPGGYDFPRVTRDGKRVAYQLDDGKETAIWVAPLSGASAPSRLTLTGANRYPIWSADGERIAFQSDREGDLGIWWQRADGVGTAERLTKPEKGASHIPDSWSKDNQTFTFTETKVDSATLWTYSLPDKKATLFARIPGATLGRSVFSPDGRWITFQADRQSATEVYVEPFPPMAGTRYVVPKIGNPHHPVWSPDGKELFYIGGASRLIGVGVVTQPSFTFSPPVEAPKSGFNTYPGLNVRNFDMLPDGHFIGRVAAGQVTGLASNAQIQVVLHWFEDVKRRMHAR